jgi:hypothetical protein
MVGECRERRRVMGGVDPVLPFQIVHEFAAVNDPSRDIAQALVEQSMACPGFIVRRCH